MLVTASSATSFIHSLELHTIHSQHPQSFPTPIPSSWKASSPFQSPLLINEKEINRYTSNTHPEPCHAITIQCSLSVCHHFGVGSSTANIIILQSSLLLCRRCCSYGLEWSDEDTFSIMRSPLIPLISFASPTSWIFRSTLKKLQLKSGDFFTPSSSRRLFNPALRKRHASYAPHSFHWLYGE